MKIVISIVGIIILLLLITVGLNAVGLINFKLFAPAFEDVRRDVFENTKSYNEGKEQDLLRYRLQYLKANEEEKQALRSTIMLMFADYDESKLDPVLQEFLKTMKYGE